MIEFNLVVRQKDFDNIYLRCERWTQGTTLLDLASVAEKLHFTPQIEIAVEGRRSILSKGVDIQARNWEGDECSDGYESEALSACSVSENSLKDTPSLFDGSI